MEKGEILISWLSDFDYCPRRFWLRSLESADGDNIYTAEGFCAHRHIHSEEIQRRHNLIKVSGLHVKSEEYNLYGVCDLVEFTLSQEGGEVPLLGERCIICPVEYKHGKTRNEREYNVQLAAQVLCLEEMFNVKIPLGYIYYTSSRQRKEVIIGEELRSYTKKVISNISTIISDVVPPQSNYMKRCHRCSLFDVCMPKKILVEKYMKGLWKNVSG